MAALNKHALREAAQEEIMLRSVSDTSDSWQDEASPEAVLALLDELERNQQYIKRRDQENEEIALTVGRLLIENGQLVADTLRHLADNEIDSDYFAITSTNENGTEIDHEMSITDYALQAAGTVDELVAALEAAKSKLNEQREYYEGVISDGSKRIAELEKSEEQLINERDHAESALADMYFAATGDRPEWSNWFGFSDAVDAVVDRIADLEAKQPSPVVPEGLIKAVRFYEQVKRENPPVETGAWKDAVDWVLKEACQSVNIGIKGE